MTLTVTRATRGDLRRVVELATRPNQLGITYSQSEIECLLCSPRHICWLVSLRDRFGDCGQVGLVVSETSAQVWTLLLFLFSCRVTARGIDTLALNALLRRARAADVSLRAHFKPTSRNEVLWLAYLRAGFEPIASDGELRVLEHPLTNIPDHPAHVRLRGDWTDDG
jgi:FkbH-like protein